MGTHQEASAQFWQRTSGPKPQPGRYPLPPKIFQPVIARLEDPNPCFFFFGLPKATNSEGLRPLLAKRKGMSEAKVYTPVVVLSSSTRVHQETCVLVKPGTKWNYLQCPTCAGDMQSELDRLIPSNTMNMNEKLRYLTPNTLDK